MTTAKVTYQGGLRTEAEHLKSGNKMITDAPTDNRGKGEAFSPTDLVATALASCILTIMGIKAADREIDIEGATAEVTKEMAANPRRIERLTVNIQMPDRNYSDEEKEILTKAAHHCPVGNSLNENLEEIVNINWVS